MSAQPRADRDRCIGSEICASLAPESFGTGEDGLVVVLEGGRPDEVAIGRAIASCPVGALSSASESSAAESSAADGRGAA